ncbi:MAG: peptidase, partial [Thermodesulfobacteriota bacterium]|nr:peptidase [Thermodesulfobacteriota bacterium]
MESPYPKTVALITFLVLYLLLPGIYSYCEAKVSLRRSAVVIAVEKVSPAVVNISTQVKEQVHSLFPFSGSDFFRDFFPDLFPREYTRTSLGSGIIIDGARGFIVTNHHVVVRAAE